MPQDYLDTPMYICRYVDTHTWFLYYTHIDFSCTVCRGYFSMVMSIYLFSMVVYMVEVKGGRGMYVDIFLIFDVEKRSFLTLCHNVFPLII